MTGALTLASPMIAAWTSASEADSSGVEAAFNEMVGALKSGNLDGFYGAMHPAFTMIDEDSPFPHEQSGVSGSHRIPCQWHLGEF